MPERSTSGEPGHPDRVSTTFAAALSPVGIRSSSGAPRTTSRITTAARGTAGGASPKASPKGAAPGSPNGAAKASGGRTAGRARAGTRGVGNTGSGGTGSDRGGTGSVGTRTDDFSRLMQANTVDTANAPARRRRRRNPIVGKIAFGLAVICLAVDASAFAVFMGGEMNFATGMCFVVVFLTLVAAVLGFVAAVGGLGRWYGVLAVVIAFAANPVVLLVVLAIVAPEATAQLSLVGA